MKIIHSPPVFLTLFGMALFAISLTALEKSDFNIHNVFIFTMGIVFGIIMIQILLWFVPEAQGGLS